MLHFVIHWPQMAANKSDMWPFAVDSCVHLHNMLPSTSTLLSPYEEVTGTQFDSYEHLTRSHVFGCPVYVLDHRLQDGNKIPKWDKRSRRGVYVGVSKHHSSTVHLILNPATGNVSPQYHCVFDDRFSSVHSDGQFNHWEWLNLFETGKDIHPFLETSDTEISLLPDAVPFNAGSLPSEGDSSPEGDQSEGENVDVASEVPVPLCRSQRLRELNEAIPRVRVCEGCL